MVWRSKPRCAAGRGRRRASPPSEKKAAAGRTLPDGWAGQSSSVTPDRHRQRWNLHDFSARMANHAAWGLMSAPRILTWTHPRPPRPGRAFGSAGPPHLFPKKLQPPKAPRRRRQEFDLCGPRLCKYFTRMAQAGRFSRLRAPTTKRQKAKTVLAIFQMVCILDMFKCSGHEPGAGGPCGRPPKAFFDIWGMGSGVQGPGALVAGNIAAAKDVRARERPR